MFKTIQLAAAMLFVISGCDRSTNAEVQNDPSFLIAIEDCASIGVISAVAGSVAKMGDVQDFGDKASLFWVSLAAVLRSETDKISMDEAKKLELARVSAQAKKLLHSVENAKGKEYDQITSKFAKDFEACKIFKRLIENSINL